MGSFLATLLCVGDSLQTKELKGSAWQYAGVRDSSQHENHHD